MNPTISVSESRFRPLWLLLPVTIVIGLMLTVIFVAVGLTRSFGLGSDTIALRDGLMKSAAADWNKEIELGVGLLPITLARTALGFLQLKPEVQAALRTFRGGDVGVYRLQARRKRPDHAVLLAAADTVMEARGWDRVVGVRNRDEMVAVYAPRRLSSPRNVRFCVVVLNHEELVIASAQGNLEPLFELACSRPEWHQKLSSSIHL